MIEYKHRLCRISIIYMQSVVNLPIASEEKETPEQKQGKIIKLARLAKGLTQKQLGDSVGLCQVSISYIEKGQGTSSVLIFRIARALGQNPNVFDV